ncbi:hypothetical protein AALB39_09130 [Lachnospiraceae bacterium 54-53]
MRETKKGHFAACHLTEEEKLLKAEEIAAREIKKAPGIEIGKEICLEVRNVRKYFPICKGMIRKKVGATMYKGTNGVTCLTEFIPVRFSIQSVLSHGLPG